MIKLHAKKGDIVSIIKKRERGSLIVISGPSGVGKDTIVNEFIKNHDNAWISVSTTSRPMRPGDVEGETYNFVTKEEFEKLIEEGYFLEYASYVDKYYGTPKKFINEKLEKGIDVFLVIEIQGAMKVKELIPDALFIFLLPPNLKTLKSRLKNRGTETKEKMIERFKTAYHEMNQVTKYNYVVICDEIDSAVKKIESIVISDKLRCDRIEEVYLNNEEEYMHEMLLEDKEMPNKVIEIEE